MIQKKDVISNKLKNQYLILKHMNNLNKNLILKKESFQEKDNLVKLNCVKVIQINKIMQLNKCKKRKDFQILKKQILLNNLAKIKIYYNIMTIIIDNLINMNILQ